MAEKTHPETKYWGKRINRGVPFKKQPVYKKVMPDGPTEELNIRPSQKIRNHSSEFNWGYAGSGPAQLALALLLAVTGNPELAQAHYQNFKFSIVAGWGEEWSISTQEILEWLGKDRTQEVHRQIMFSKN